MRAALERARERERDLPSDSSGAGCALAIVAIVTIVLMPFIGRGLDLSSGVMGLLGVSLAAVAGVGGLIGIFGGGAARQARIDAVAAAIDTAGRAHALGDDDAFLDAVAFLLDNAFLPSGPFVTPSFDRSDTVERLGSALTRVEGIEQVLLEADEILPVFTGS